MTLYDWTLEKQEVESIASKDRRLLRGWYLAIDGSPAARLTQ